MAEFKTNPTEINLAGVDTSVRFKQNQYTPTWTASAGANPVLNDGTLIGWWINRGDTILVSITLLAGAGTTFGGAGNWQFGLPNAQVGHGITGSMWCFDSSANTSYIGVPIMLTNVLVIKGAHNASATFTGFATPFAWAVGDIMVLTIEYAVRL